MHNIKICASLFTYEKFIGGIKMYKVVEKIKNSINKYRVIKRLKIERIRKV